MTRAQEAARDRVAEMFSRIRYDRGCWLWTRNKDTQGYGVFTFKGKIDKAHRAVFKVVREEPGGLHLDHLCRNTLCVNPDHLEPVTAAENFRRGTGMGPRNAAKTHCPNGHPYDMRDATGRRCRACHSALSKERKRRYIERKRARQGASL